MATKPDKFGVGNTESRKKRLEHLWTALMSERSSFDAHWRSLAEFIRPRRIQFQTADANKGESRNQKIVDSTATLASRTGQAGMQGGITSPARPWFKLSTPNQQLSEAQSVKEWLHLVTKRMQAAFLKSNFYNASPIAYGDLLDFATAAIFVEEDFENVMHFTVFPIGSYSIALDDKGRVRVFIREFPYTVRQMVDKWATLGEDGQPDMSIFSKSVQDHYNRNQLDTKIDIRHVVQKNKNYNPKSLTSKRFESVYYEKSNLKSPNRETENKYLSDKGYDYFPVLGPRWSVSGEDIYGTDCPGMTALGDIKALQTMQKRLAQAVEKSINPAMTAPTSLKNARASVLPGDITYLNATERGGKFEPAYQINPDIGALLEMIREHQQRIKRAYFEDLFLMLADLDRKQITATEVMERKEEKLLALGPVLEQLNVDFLDPLIEIAYLIMERQGMIPEAPEELQNVELKVEYISIMHTAQKLAGLGGIERFTDYVSRVAEIMPQVLDKFDGDQAVDEVADITGVPPSIVRSDDAVIELREVRAQIEKAKLAQEQMAQGAQVAKDLSQANTGGDNALTELMERSEAGALQ